MNQKTSILQYIFCNDSVIHYSKPTLESIWKSTVQYKLIGKAEYFTLLY